ncbi:metallo-beta-lactamase superfamily protein [Entamoeba histolytica HM-1:IMSS-B]|uniref:Metallo-beta-lactamase superfamily protein n=5 Tax=Entamoeba histolytica TaxID=5759 RepID=C4MAP5_ENTH1|nr:metallo-beta-lactamase superfamily protein [Entamoeba histolytica HM-1:IMSS]EMD49613.1 alkyl/arylsulfatase BDS1, putative [Entamoeba histolytica KU27]EMH74062.1 metallo-beta-lactamase superfamily protein [Entamoeba histolytica HM-1:IMSS-B]ENY65025.1 alkyl/aryl-sulfatase BDS1, putative [Entamoeba histolytica HM-1:IMSS-A]GAT98898.1 metallo-beta-lactamase superfamily protein [Entamoeba histolytica]EAL43619.1 metallo-beta-lactamase superfamily protein [Entamoeba histolytica HM-1:IMSS]|eukprot:XP_649008.1 metallo-beta-lactamase superfamily protein [Entamoeba histolytica HM-1:IMSS]
MACQFVKEEFQRIKNFLNFDDKQDYEDAHRGFIADIPDGIIKSEDGSIVYSINETNFLEDECPETVNPSLWRQCQLNRVHGLFEVVKGKIYQFRGYDIANMTFIKGEKGWIVIDTLCSVPGCKAGLELFRSHIDNLPITAVIITHSHGDHCGGLEAVLEENTIVYWPMNLREEFVSEKMLAGVAMDRRCVYMFGQNLPQSKEGFIGCGLGQAGCQGSKSHLNCKEIIEIHENKTYTIDGVIVDFIFTPGAEAPTEMMMYFPQLKALCTAEEINRLMHNLYTPRGAKVRNGKLWAGYIDYIIMKYGDDIEVSFGTHNWPTWGNKKIIEYYEKQRDMYKYLHDQTLRNANLGYTPNELPEHVKLPESLSKVFYNREYYGTVSHNIKAQYQFYLGWYDGNPAHLNELTPTEQGKKYVEVIGGETRCIELAQQAFEKGEFQWAITLLNHLIFANPKNTKARELAANVYTQLGYLQESAVWRNEYLTAAMELRSSEMKNTISMPPGNDIKHIKESSLNDIFDVFSVNVDPNKIDGLNEVINIVCKESNEAISVVVKNNVINVRQVISKNPTITVISTKQNLLNLYSKKLTQQEFSKNIEFNGKLEGFYKLLESITIPSPIFEIIEP